MCFYTLYIYNICVPSGTVVRNLHASAGDTGDLDSVLG